ncbi:MAG TPA: outer membrane beta-barrel protein [Candidatus Binatia bacterium]|nr:outer membrane beta-barrel protein [Candidatus Binatia bacterium]
MKDNKMQKWTLALAAAGLITIPVGAEEKPSPILTALSSTTISGYVSTSAQWNPGTGDAFVPPYAFNANKQDGFNLDAVRLTIERPLDEAQWSAGYRADLFMGPDADALATQSTGTAADFGIKQAYVALRAPVGNGLDFKLGVWDTIIGYESTDSGNNPNYTRSYGYTVEPTTHTGLLLTYQLLDTLGFSAGIANTMGPRINLRAHNDVNGDGHGDKAESHKTYMASLAFTVPESAGFLAGSTVYTGVIEGFGSSEGDQLNYYLGATVNTPITGVKVGAAFDYVHDLVVSQTPLIQADARVYGAYVSFQATEKLSLHGRLEYADVDDVFGSDIFAITGTLQYDLWKNVLSRLEVRWDHDASGNESFGGETVAGGPDKKNFYTIAANLIYKF